MVNTREKEMFGTFKFSTATRRALDDIFTTKVGIKLAASHPQSSVENLTHACTSVKVFRRYFYISV